ncbi:MAG: response regulator [Filimonas sp.]|nr:response regulator [Filimonas sp.]
MYEHYSFLVVEDIAVDQYIARHVLSESLHAADISIVNNGSEGLDWINTHWPRNGKKLILLLDIQMPVMNGFAFLEAYDKLPGTSKTDTTIFVLSSTLNRDDIKRVENNQYVTKFLNKPLDEDVLKKLIE